MEVWGVWEVPTVAATQGKKILKIFNFSAVFLLVAR